MELWKIISIVSVFLDVIKSWLCLSDNTLDIIAIIIAFGSLIIAQNTLRLTVTKPGITELHVYTKPSETQITQGGTINGIGYFIVTLTVVIKNSGAQPISFKELKSKIECPPFFEVRIIFEPDFTDRNGLMVLGPYEHKIGHLGFSLYFKGHGKGFDDPELIKSHEMAVNYLRKQDFKARVVFEYDELGRDRMIQKRQGFDLTEIILQGMDAEGKIRDKIRAK